MGFSLKLAPGVRVRASSRGLRTSIGPRAAKVHVGAGRTGISTGAGPVSFYTSISGSSRSRSRSSTGASTRALAAAAKATEAQQLATALKAILDLHRPPFAPAQRPVAPPPPPVDVEPLRVKHRQAALNGLGLFDRQGRGRAKAAAEQAAHGEAAQIHANNLRMQQEYQNHLDQIWSRLFENDPDIVLGVLAEAFEDNEAAAAPLGVERGEASVAVLVPPPSAVPERRPTTTPAGNLSLKKLNKSEAAGFYRLMVFGYVLVTVKEAFAVAPNLDHVRVIALRNSGPDAYGQPRVEAVLAARFARNAFTGVLWDSADADRIIVDTSTEFTVKVKGASKELVPLDPATEPDVAALLAAVDTSELA